MTKVIGTFLVGTFAGLCAVFVPRMGGLLVAEELTRITVFPAPFIVLGFIYAAVIGAVVAIMYHGETSTLRQKFMTALGIPALLAGTLTTTAQTGEVRNLQTHNSRLAEVARTGEKIKKIETPFEIIPLELHPNLKPSPSGRVNELLGIGTAFAADTTSSAGKESWTGWGAVQAQEPRYAIVVDRATDAKKAVQRANELKAQFSNVQAIRTPDGYAVITGVRPESSAVLEAIRIKRETGLQPELMRVK